MSTCHIIKYTNQTNKQMNIILLWWIDLEIRKQVGETSNIFTPNYLPKKVSNRYFCQTKCKKICYLWNLNIHHQLYWGTWTLNQSKSEMFSLHLGKNNARIITFITYILLYHLLFPVKKMLDLLYLKNNNNNMHLQGSLKLCNNLKVPYTINIPLHWALSIPETISTPLEYAAPASKLAHCCWSSTVTTKPN